MIYLTIILCFITLPTLIITLMMYLTQNRNISELGALKTHIQQLQQTISQQQQHNAKTQEHLQQTLREQQQKQQERDLHLIKEHHQVLTQSMQSVREQLTFTLKQQQQHITEHLGLMRQELDKHIKQLSGQVEQRLSAGFDKTTAVFTDVIKRLALIDQAQQKITELSNHVVDLQSVLTDKKARGAFGEVQLESLVRNILPANHYEFQVTLSNQKRVDCLLKLPEPTGLLAIDAKFPLENYRAFIDARDDTTKKQALSKLKQDIRHHIQAIASKYLIPGETSDGAIMFIPAEAIFSDIHSLLPDVVDEAFKAKVWLVSPTTMMAILNTAMVVLKDQATKKQVHIIQQHLGMLRQDFIRFQKRMDQLAKHIDQAQNDVHMVHQSSKKISSRFTKIDEIHLNNTLSTTAAPNTIDQPLEIQE
ncbi:MAG: DNA recombination protein RmuC [Candidatus Comchoanobacterales bacterium]